MKRYPIATVSVILGVLSFVHLFGLEKAVLAVILGGVALRSGEAGGRKIALAGVVLGSLYIFVLVAIMLMKGPALLDLVLR